MPKTLFPFIVMGIVVLVATNSSHAAPFESMFSGLRSAAEPAPAKALEPFAWSQRSSGPVVQTGYFDTETDSYFGESANGDESSTCGGTDGCCDGCVGGWRDNTELWIGADAHRAFGDGRFALFNPLPFATGNSFGFSAGFNTGFALGDSCLRGQVGASYGGYDFKGRTIDDPGQAASVEQQTFVTFGVYKRSDVCGGDRLSYGLVYDQFFGHQWGWTADEVYLSQFRGIVGYAVSDANEFGFWGTFRSNDDVVGISSVGANITTNVRAMNQANAYWRHNWDLGAMSMFYLGGFDQADVASWQFGMLNTAPLNDRVSVYANFNYVVPGSPTGLVGAAEEQWYAGVGFTVSLGGLAASPTVSGNAGLPLLPVANNGSLLVTN